MATQYLIEPNPVWAFLGLDGLPAAGGFIYTYESTNHLVPKATYQDDTGETPWSNPITLDSTGKQSYLGTCFPIFWANDAPYYIVITDADNQEIFAGSGFPWTASSQPIVTETDIENYFINGQFYFNFGSVIDTSGDVGFNDLPATPFLIAPDNWWFSKNNTSATDTIIFTDFDPGETQVPNNPKAYVTYNCTVPGSSETSKNIYYRFNSVRQFSGENLNLQFYAKSTLSSQLDITLTQYFGAGGSTTIITPVVTKILTTNFALYQITVAVPSIESQIIGPNGDDYLTVNFGPPLNTVSNLSVSNSCFRAGEVFVAIQEESVNIITEEFNASSLPLPTSVNWDDGNYYLKMIGGVQTWLPCAGLGGECYVNTPPSDALLCNGLSYFQSQYYNLAQKNLVEAWGTGAQGFTTSTGGTATVTATCFSNGAVISGSAGTTSFTYTQTNNGGAMTQGAATILHTAGNTVDPGNYFLINSPAVGSVTAIDYYVWFSLNNQTKDPQAITPALSGKTGVKVVYTGSETNIQLAALTATQLSVAHFRVPDVRGLFTRMPNFGATAVLPSYGTITLTSTGDLSAINFTIVGLDLNGNTLAPETLAGPNNNTVTSVNLYSAITSITPASAVGTDVSVGVTAPADPDGMALLQTTGGATALIFNGVYARDPDYATRYAMYTGGATADNVGSQQQNQILSHVHPLTYQFTNVDSGGGGGPQGVSDFQSGGTTSNSGAAGGNQANPNNVSVNKIIYF